LNESEDRKVRVTAEAAGFGLTEEKVDFRMLSYEARDSATLFELWQDVLRYKWTVLLTLLGIILLASWIASSTPIYRSEVVMMSADTESTRNSLASMAGGLAQSGLFGLFRQSKGDSKPLAILQSRSFIRGFIEAENVFPDMYAGWSRETRAWRDTVPEDNRASMNDAVNRFRNSILRLSEGEVPGTMILAIEWRYPNKAADWANKIVERLNDVTRTAAIEEAEANIEFLYQEMQNTAFVDLRRAISRLIEAQANTIMLANVSSEYAYTVIDPAVPADMDHYVSPRRFTIMFVGFFFGLALGIFIALMRGSLRRSQL